MFPFLEMLTVSSPPRPSSADSSFEVETDTDYLRIAKKGGGHKGWLMLLDIINYKGHSQHIVAVRAV